MAVSRGDVQGHVLAAALPAGRGRCGLAAEAVVYTAHHDHLGLGEPDATACTLSGKRPPAGYVDLHYLHELAAGDVAAT